MLEELIGRVVVVDMRSTFVCLGKLQRLDNDFLELHNADMHDLRDTQTTRERYVDVRPLGIDDFDAADDLIARGVAEGYLAPRSPEQLDRVFTCGVGAFVEGRHLAGIGALLPYPEARAGEIASLYTLTRFLGEGIGSHLIATLCERARKQGYAFVFACTTTERVAGFFERYGFRRVGFEEVPADKWHDYDRRRRPLVRCLRKDLQPES